MRVLLTGASGMLGSHIASALLRGGHEVRCLLRRPGEPGLTAGLAVERVGGDVCDADSLAAAVRGMEAVVHCAGVVSYWKKKAPQLWEVNVEGTRRLKEAAIAEGIRRFVLTSSIAAVGFVEGDGLGDESCPFNWGPYDIAYCDTKRASEALILEDPRIEGVAVNPGIVMGSQDLHFNGGRILAQVVKGKVTGIPPGSTTLCTAFDAAEGHRLALERGAPGRRYILGGHPLSFLQVYRRCAEVVGEAIPERVIPPSVLLGLAHAQAAWGDLRDVEPQLTPQLANLSIRNRRYRSDRAVAELGYPISPLEGALEEAYRWYRDEGML